jgi:hypothetical protein
MKQERMNIRTVSKAHWVWIDNEHNRKIHDYLKVKWIGKTVSALFKKQGNQKNKQT